MLCVKFQQYIKFHYIKFQQYIIKFQQYNSAVHELFKWVDSYFERCHY